MTPSHRRPCARLVLALVLGVGGGCSHEPLPLSPTAAEAPERAARAAAEMEVVARRNREAEARFFRAAADPEASSSEGAEAPRTRTSIQDRSGLAGRP